MNRITLILACGAFATLVVGTSHAEDFSLSNPHRFETENVNGKCGAAFVSVSGFKMSPGALLNFPNKGDVTVSFFGPNGRKSVGADSLGLLRDGHKLKCISSGGNNYFVIWSACIGSACKPEEQYAIIDTATLDVVAPVITDQRSRSWTERDVCDFACASRILGKFDLN
ncbi:hypothetical protein [Azospirillum sp.]|uniref:hypothetical protein n=1 Tax=Azospirillum sp. TaxID=34012 RepID=UPI003D75D2F7